MKTLIEKLPLSGNTSFVARIFSTPFFEVPWHQHEEYELIMFLEGDGLSFVGNFSGEFRAGDIFFIGKNVPHTFQKRNRNMVTSAVVIQFKEDFWGEDFINLPEMRSLKELFKISMQGLRINGKTRSLLKKIILEIEDRQDFMRIVKLLECLYIIESRKEYASLSTQEVKLSNPKDMERIDRVFRYTIDSFQGKIALSDVAEVAGLSVPAFCNYFKKSTKKTYIDFLNEIRVGFACKLLIEGDLSIVNICYESGYNTLANFNKQFLKIKHTTPSQFRRVFTARNAA